jgi:hypothetical protein
MLKKEAMINSAVVGLWLELFPTLCEIFIYF